MDASQVSHGGIPSSRTVSDKGGGALMEMCGKVFTKDNVCEVHSRDKFMRETVACGHAFDLWRRYAYTRASL